MLLDGLIIVAYFVVILVIGLRSRAGRDTSSEEYFLSSRSLRWPSIACSTIATNIHANHFIGMMGSAYLFGLAQANFEINAILGILVATFVFVPLYLRMRVVTLSQFFEAKLGPKVALAYSLLMILLYSFLMLGMALFWAAYAVEGAFGELLGFLGTDRTTRLCLLIAGLGLFSAGYTWLGGMRAVVRTDVVQFVLFLGGGLCIAWIAVDKLGGWSSLLTDTGDLMHLHLSRDHPTLPWTALIGMNLLNLNYWGANQVILQRALAAKNLRHAQIGLLVGGLIKYVIVLIVIVPGIALAGLMRDDPLQDPDQAYMTLIGSMLPDGLRGLVLVGLFASMMSTVDSIYHSVSTLWSVDVYKRHLKRDASDLKVVAAGRRAILVTFATGMSFAFYQVYVKTTNTDLALVHWFNELSYYVKNGFVVLICSAVFLLNPNRRLVLFTLLSSCAATYFLKVTQPEMNYLNRSALVILASFAVVAVPTLLKNGWRIPRRDLFTVADRRIGWYGMTLLASLLACHVVFH